MNCSICGGASDSDTCSRCLSLMQVAPALTHVPMAFRGSARAQIRDRQWEFQHASEALQNPEISETDLVSIRDRLPRSKRGMVLRRKIDKRIARGSAFVPKWKDIDGFDLSPMTIRRKK